MSSPRKGRFGRWGFPVSDRYVDPGGRNRFVGAGLLAAGIVGAMLLVNFSLGSRKMLSGGELSSAHASLENGCAACHVGFDGVDETRCASCHAPDGGAAAAFRATDHAAMAAPTTNGPAANSWEVSCTTCHDEHRGRGARLDKPADARCSSCHVVTSFAADHPEFSVVRTPSDSPDRLRFDHQRHLARLLALGRDAAPTQTCRRCHLPDGSGGAFRPIAFDTACASCHPGPNARIGNLPLRAAGSRLVEVIDGEPLLRVGVEAPATPRQRRGPGEEWAQHASDSDYRITGSRISKLRVEHRDPWVLHNLRQLREALYPGSAAAALLDARPMAPTVSRADRAPEAAEAAYMDAIAGLRQRRDGLRDQPEIWVQSELEEIERWLGQVEDRLEGGAEPLPAEWFDPTPNPLLDDETRAELLDLASRLSAPCATCHQIDGAAVVAVPRKPGSLRATRFDHAPHRQQLDCATCHPRVSTPLAPDETGGSLADVSAPDAAAPSPPRLDLPGIETCRTCHVEERTELSCVSCHIYHPTSAHAGGR